MESFRGHHAERGALRREEFLPERDPGGLAARLRRKARADATATRKFAADPEISDDITGFHAQPASFV